VLFFKYLAFGHSPKVLQEASGRKGNHTPVSQSKALPAGPAWFCLSVHFYCLSENILQFPVRAGLITFSNAVMERKNKREVVLRTKDSSREIVFKHLWILGRKRPFA